MSRKRVVAICYWFVVLGCVSCDVRIPELGRIRSVSVFNAGRHLIEKSIEAEGRLENLSELVGFARSFETIDAFLEQVSLVADTDDLDDDDLEQLGYAPDELIGRSLPDLMPPGVQEEYRAALATGALPKLRMLVTEKNRQAFDKLMWIKTKIVAVVISEVILAMLLLRELWQLRSQPGRASGRMS